MAFKWRHLYGHMTHAWMDMKWTTCDQEARSSFTANSLTFGPIPALAVKKKKSLCGMHCTSSSLLHSQPPVRYLLWATPGTATSTNVLPPWARSSHPKTQDWSDAQSGLMYHGASSWSFRVISGFRGGPHAQNHTSYIGWLTTGTPALEIHSSGLRCLHPCKKRRHHKKGKHGEPNQPLNLSEGDLVHFLPKGQGEMAQGHQGANRRRGNKQKDNVKCSSEKTLMNPTHVAMGLGI